MLKQRLPLQISRYLKAGPDHMPTQVETVTNVSEDKVH